MGGGAGPYIFLVLKTLGGVSVGANMALLVFHHLVLLLPLLLLHTHSLSTLHTRHVTTTSQNGPPLSAPPVPLGMREQQTEWGTKTPSSRVPRAPGLLLPRLLLNPHQMSTPLPSQNGAPASSPPVPLEVRQHLPIHPPVLTPSGALNTHSMSTPLTSRTPSTRLPSSSCPTHRQCQHHSRHSPPH